MGDNTQQDEHLSGREIWRQHRRSGQPYRILHGPLYNLQTSVSERARRRGLKVDPVFHSGQTRT